MKRPDLNFHIRSDIWICDLKIHITIKKIPHLVSGRGVPVSYSAPLCGTILVMVVRVCAKSQHFTAMTHSQGGQQPTTLFLLSPFILKYYELELKLKIMCKSSNLQHTMY